MKKKASEEFVEYDEDEVELIGAEKDEEENLESSGEQLVNTFNLWMKI